MNGFEDPEIIFLLDEKSNSFRSAMITLSDDSHHPLADTDPLISPPLLLKNPKDLPNTNGDESWTVGNPRKESESVVLKITVSNPKKEIESSSSIVPGGNTYVTYLITTKTNIHEFGVRRRFKDVVTLSDRLAEAYRGFFIPPRPDKSVVESQVMQKHEFVEQRRHALEKYLQRLGEHPVIRQSDELRVFLQVQGQLPLLPTAAVTSRMLDGVTKLSKHLLGDSSVQPAKSRWDFIRIMNQNDWGGPRSSTYEEDPEFLKNKERLLDLEKQLTSSSKLAEIFVKAQQDIAETMGAFGLSFIKLTKFENQHAVVDTQRERAADMKNLATAAIKSSRYYRELNSRTIKHLDTLHDHVGLLLGVHTAFSDRLTALLTVQTRTSELNTLCTRAEKLEKIGKPITLELREVKEAIRVTEDAKSCATSEYERIKGNNRAEIERLDRQRKVDLKDMLKGFVINQVAFLDKMGIEWAKVAEETRGYAC
ncbi:hypothetical protein L1987_85801 [Smallanthus sonchifolius]|uniref:Uncharacterized protein n=1 Tax=Smallanthus sonchifolius TaxID=185202 RepID=A0ACB8XXJ3_9ASTR|nr:hypothetical protein L1987_85801 [Smallanthus sonchifolius]